jgi:hypothetical protein
MGNLYTWKRYREAKKNQRQKASDLAELIERLVQESDLGIRKVPGYRQQLQKPVEEIAQSELEIPGRAKRIAVLASVCAAECLDQ